MCPPQFISSALEFARLFPFAEMAIRRLSREATLDGPINHLYKEDCSFRTYNNMAYPSGVLNALYGSSASLLNYGILLFFPKELINDRLGYARTAPSVNWLLLARHGEVVVSDIRPNLNKSRSISGFADVLVDAASKGYICGVVDDFYLGQSPRKLRFHYKHETLITGIDLRRRVCWIAMYDSLGIFRNFEVPLSLMIVAFLSEKGWPNNWTYDAIDKADGFCSAMRKPVFQIRKGLGERAPLDRGLIAMQIRDVLLSQCNYRRYIGDPMTNWIEGDGYFGLAVYDAYCTYIEKCRREGAVVDLCATRLLWEHKILMLERISILSSEGCRIGNTVSESFVKIEKIAKGIHLACVFSLNPGGYNSFDCSRIVRSIRLMKDLEQCALAELLDYLEVSKTKL